MKTVCILRHAEAVPPEPVQDDMSRALTAHGRSQCAERAMRLGAGTVFERIVASPATRTVTTAEIVLRGRGPVQLEPCLYNASADTLWRLISGIPDSVASIAIVGHNPGMSDIAARLTGRVRHLSPASLLILEAGTSWNRISPGAARVITAMVD